MNLVNRFNTSVRMSLSSTWIRCLVKYWILIGFAICSGFIAAKAPYNNGPHIRSDGVGYHLWTHAIFKGDFSFSSHANFHEIVCSFHNETLCLNKYPPGVALLRFPVMAWVTDLNLTDHFSNSEHMVSAFLGWLALVVTVVMIVASLRSLMVRSIFAQIIAVLFALGAGLFHYATYDNSFSHIYSAMLAALLLHLALKVRAKSSEASVTYDLIGIFIICMFLGLVRNTNAFILGFLLLWAYWGQIFQRRFVLVGVAAFSGFAAAIFSHLFYVMSAHPSGGLFSYNQESFIWDRPMFGSVLFSYERGLFSYYPLLLLPLVVLALLCLKKRDVGLSLLPLCVSAYASLYGFWHSWYLGGGFGHRGFVEIVPFAAVVFGESVARIESVLLRSVILGLVPILSAVSLVLMLGYWNGALPFQGATAEIFFNQFAPSSLRPEALWVLIAGTLLSVWVFNQMLRTKDKNPLLA